MIFFYSSKNLKNFKKPLLSSSPVQLSCNCFFPDGHFTSSQIALAISEQTTKTAVSWSILYLIDFEENFNYSQKSWIYMYKQRFSCVLQKNNNCFYFIYLPMLSVKCSTMISNDYFVNFASLYSRILSLSFAYLLSTVNEHPNSNKSF